MASSLYKPSVFIAFFCLVLFSGKHIVEGDDLCQVLSGIFAGNCLDDQDCNNECKDYEGAISGHCQNQKCFCVKNCQQKNLCIKPSGRFHGPCFDYYACHNLCKGGEGAVGGKCQGFKCNCFYNC